MQTEKPLLGFGWMGWVLLAIAGALVVVWVTGYDLQYQLLAVVHAVLGDDGLDWFISNVWTWHSLCTTYVHSLANFSLWAMCAVVIAMYLYPTRLRWWRWLPVILWALASPPLLPVFYRFFRPVIYPTNLDGYTYVMLGVQFVIAVATLGLLTRSVRVMIGFGTLGIGSMAFAYFSTKLGHTAYSRPVWFHYLVQSFNWAWNPLLLAILLSWAIPARLRYNRWWLCFKCGYNMRNLEANTCPECGVINNRMPVNTTAASASE